MDDLLERAFGGSALDLLATTLASRKLDSSEREEIAQLLAKAKEKRP